jgi:hypothetical protein
MPGDLLLEADRALSPVFVQPIGVAPLTIPTAGNTTPPGATGGKIWDLVKPDQTDMKGLRSALTFLKLTPSDLENYFNAIGSLVNAVSGIVSIVGAISTAKDLLTKLGVFQSTEFNTQAALEQIGLRLQQVYSYLATADRKGLFVEARQWREDIAKARAAVAQASQSRSPDTLKSLVEKASDLDGSLSSMLDPQSGYITFQRLTYQYAPYAGHWIDYSAPPFMTLANGAPINYTAPSAELATVIWDPGHYIDVLIRTLADRLLIVATIEPLFRSTGYDRFQLHNLVTGLTAFIEKWKASILVVDPAAGINAGGHIRHPAYTKSAPHGILLGAVDPVTGVAAWIPEWTGLAIQYTTNTSVFSPGTRPDYGVASDPTKALKDAAEMQWAMLDFVIGASGIPKLVQLRTSLLKAASRVIGSEVVELPDASFDWVETPWLSPQSEIVDLGRLQRYATDPNKTYSADRYFQEIEKTFRFRIARRTDVSLTQLGYKLRIADQVIKLVDFTRSPFDGQGVVAFPTVPIPFEFETITTHVYDVFQSRVISQAEEDTFEQHGEIPGVRRLFLNERTGSVSLTGQISFEHDPYDQGYTGEVVVTIRNRNPVAFRDAAILAVSVLETHADSDPLLQIEELADEMTIHMVPSFLKVGVDYFNDFDAAQIAMAKVIVGIDVRFGLRDFRAPIAPDPQPKWAVRREWLETSESLDLLDRFGAKNAGELARQIQRNVPPAIRQR